MDQSNLNFDSARLFPMMALRGLTIFPGMMMNFEVERRGSIAALDRAMKDDQIIFLAGQKDLTVDVPTTDDVYTVGTVSRIKQMMKQPGGKTVRVMVEGLERGRVVTARRTVDGFEAIVEPLPDLAERNTAKSEALIRNCCNLFDDYIHASGHLAPEAIINILGSTNAAFVADFISQHVFFRPEVKQSLLEELRPTKRLEALGKHLSREIDVLQIQHDLEEAAQERVNQQQQEYYLREQMKVIQSELGEGGDDDEDNYADRIRDLHLAEDSEKHLLKEVRRLKKQPFGSSEASVIRNYLDVCLEIPWNNRTKETLDIAQAQKTLDADHYGLEKVKERIIESLAVRQLTPDARGTVLCLVGPPGTGKTSIAMSVAHALNRKLARISLGGVHDEAEIRGHRKTYIGALPGRILNGIARAGTSNPVIVLDEVDKLAADFKGDPSAALLEALDPEQNSTFHDNYLDLDYDLSHVLFITTANSTSPIQPALLDRMELINVTGYLAEEKMEIARKFLVPKQLEEHGIARDALRIDKAALAAIIDEYTHESGVRGLEKQIAKLARVTAKKIALGQEYPETIKKEHLKEYLGLPTNFHDLQKGNEAPGVVTGLAWTQMGGEILFVESSVSNGKGVMSMTGNLGDVMKESATIAYQYIKAHPELAKMDSKTFSEKDIHVHVPEGATPKDGPSAGITMVSSMVSALRGQAVRHGIAMTGEMTLRGRVLPVGGIKEKILAAKRAGVKTIVISEDNRKDVEDIKEIYVKGLDFHYVKDIQDVIAYVFAD